MSTDPMSDRDAVRAFVNGDLTRGQFLDIVGYDPVGMMQEAREAAKVEPPARTYKKRNGVEPLPSGKWRVRYRDEEKKPVSATFDSYAEALAFRDDQRVAVRKGTHVAPNAGNITFRQYAEQWLSEHDASQSTIDAHETRLRVHVYGAFGGQRLGDITEDAVRRWHRRDLTSLATSTRRAVLTSFSSVLAAAAKQRLIMSNPAGPDVIKRRRSPAKKFVPLEADQVLAISDALPERYRVLAILGAGLGLRQGELFGLSLSDFDFVRELLTVHRQIKVVGGGSRLVFAHPKGGEHHPVRQVPIPESVRAAVIAYAEQFPANLCALPWETSTAKPVSVPLLVTSREGKPLNKNYINGAVWKPALREARVPDTREHGMHALRHYYASTLLDGGETIEAVAEYLGHADPGFTLRTYTHVMKRSHSRTKSAIDTAFAAAQTGSNVTQLSQRRSESA